MFFGVSEKVFGRVKVVFKGQKNLHSLGLIIHGGDVGVLNLAVVTWLYLQELLEISFIQDTIFPKRSRN